MTESSKVSIILTVYNKPKWLNQCIDSVLDQTYQNWELLIMEDNSPDPRVREIIESYTDERIKVYYSNIADEDRYKTARYATLINIAEWTMATGKYITYLVDDDYYYPGRLQKLVQHLDNHPTHDVVYHPIMNVDADGHDAGVRGVKGVLDGLTADTQAFDYVDHNMVMHTKKSFDRVGKWYDDPGVWGGADAYFWRHLNQAGYMFYPVGDNDHPLGAKRYHTESVQWAIVDRSFTKEDREARGLPPF